MDRIDHKDDTLPVTAEVGDEGGSYAEPVNQRATLGGPAAEAEQNRSETDDRGRRVHGRRWRKGLVGVSAGSAALRGVSRLRRRS